MLEIRADCSVAADVLPLLNRHLDLMRASSPPESVHALDPEALNAPEVDFFTLREGETVLAMGAIKAISPDHAEVKSMHVVSEARGRGLSAQLLARLVEQAKARGYTRLSLETGIEEVFAPARKLYEKAGFTYCGPFEGYTDDPNSVFMTRPLA